MHLQQIIIVVCAACDDVLQLYRDVSLGMVAGDSAFGGFRFVCRGRLRILHVIRLGENSSAPIRLDIFVIDFPLMFISLSGRRARLV